MIFATDLATTTKQIETLRKEESFISKIIYKDFTANISLNKAKKGEFYGISSLLPNNDKKENFIYDYKTIELSNKFTITNNFSIEPKIGLFKYDYFMDITKMAAPIIIDANVKYDKKYIAVDSIYTKNNYEIIAGIEKSQTDEVDSVDSSTNTFTGVTTVTVKSSNDFYKRKLDAIYLHNNIKITNKLRLNMGIRYETYDDKYNDKLTHTTLPRLATVYSYDDNNIIKFQYGEAYRPPTFLEGTAQPETIDTYELQYIYLEDKSKFKGTMFYSTIKKLIVNTGGSNYINKTEDIISQGIELELLYNFSNNFLLNSNISYNDVFEKESKQILENYSKVLANLSLSYLPYSRFSSTISTKYLSEKKRVSTDSRDALSSQYSVDLTFKYLPQKTKNSIEINFGIKNIFDDYIKTPSEQSTINDDLLYSARNYFVEVVYKF